MKKLFYLVALFVTVSAQAQIGFQAAPGKVFFSLQGGETGQQTVTLVNATPTKQILKCHFEDWYRDSVGNKIYSAPGNLPNSCSKYVKVYPETIELQPNETRKVELTMILPKELGNRVTNSMLYVTQVNEKNVDEKSNVKKAQFIFQVQLGIHIYNQPPSLQVKSMEINKVRMDWEQVKKDPGRKDPKTLVASDTIDWVNNLKAYIENNGQLVAEGDLRFELTHQASLKEWKLDAVPYNSLPGDKLILARELPKELTKGKYTVVSILNFGDDSPLKIAESEIEIK